MLSRLDRLHRVQRIEIVIQRIRPQRTYGFRKIPNDLDELLRLGRRNPCQMHSSLQPHEGEQILNKRDTLDGHVITIQVMTVADMSTADEDTVGATL